MRRPHLPASLRHRQFRLWYAGATLSALGTAMVPVTITFAVLSRFHTASAVGVVLTAEAAPLALLLLLGGVVGDRVSRRRLLLGADLVSALAQGLAAALLVAGHWQLWQLAALFAVEGAATGLSSPALLGMVADVVPAADRQQANTLRSLATSGAGIAGPAVAGLVAGLGGGGLGLAVNAGTYAVSALLLAAMAPTPAAARSGTGVVADLVHGWREFTSRTWLWSIVAQFGLFHLLVWPPVLVLGAVVAERDLGGASAWGLVLAALGAGEVVGGLVMLRWRPARPLLTGTLSAAVFSLLAATLALRAALPWQLATAAAAGALVADFEVLWNTALTTHIPAEVLSRVSAYDWFGSVVLLPVGYAVVGPIAAAIGVAATLWVAAGSWLVLCGLTLLVRDVRTMPRLDGHVVELA